jgi:hypothetical protein
MAFEDGNPNFEDVDMNERSNNSGEPIMYQDDGMGFYTKP